jgi:hypothetical protein
MIFAAVQHPASLDRIAVKVNNVKMTKMDGILQEITIRLIEPAGKWVNPQSEQ